MVWGFLLARFDLTPTFCRPAALLPPNTPLLSGGSRAVLSQGRSLSCRAMKALGAGGSELDGTEGERAGGAQRRSLASAWAQRSLPGDSCPLSVPPARPWSPRPPQCFLRPAEHHGEQHLPPGGRSSISRALGS